MDSRLKLNEELNAIDEELSVYFQPPPSVNINYPAIIYSRANIRNTFASNGVYKQGRTYQVIVIDKNPDSSIVDKVSLMDSVNHQKHYTANNLNYDVFTLYYNKK